MGREAGGRAIVGSTASAGPAVSLAARSSGRKSSMARCALRAFALMRDFYEDEAGAHQPLSAPQILDGETFSKWP